MKIDVVQKVMLFGSSPSLIFTPFSLPIEQEILKISFPYSPIDHIPRFEKKFVWFALLRTNDVKRKIKLAMG